MKRNYLALFTLAAFTALSCTADPAPDQEARQDMFKAADTNGDGTISLDEFKAMQAKREAMRQNRLGDKAGGDAKRPSAEDMFAKLDTNHDGKLTREEITAGRQDAMFRRIDANHDGFISLDELKAMQAKREAMRQNRRDDQNATADTQKHPDAAALFAKMDTNHDGKLSEQEFEAARKAMAERHPARENQAD